MTFTEKDLALLNSEQNKPAYDTLFGLLENELENILDDTDILSMSAEREAVMGTCGVYFSSMRELLHKTRELMQTGFIESAGVLAASLWERALTLRKILTSPEENSQQHVDHRLGRSTPWPVKGMVKDVVADQQKRYPEHTEPMAAEMMYLEYTLLSAIKHGNPYTISYLNRPERDPQAKLFALQPNQTEQDKDLKIYILLLACSMVMEALTEYSLLFRTSFVRLEGCRDLADQLMKIVKLNVPPMFLSDPKEMTPEFWDHMVALNASH